MKSLLWRSAAMISADRVGHCHVGTDVQPEPGVGELGRRGRRDDLEHRGPVVEPLRDVMEVDGVGLTGVGSPQQDDVGLLDLKVREYRHTPNTAARPTTLGVSSSIAQSMLFVPRAMRANFCAA